jgi:hypothetical protein
MCEEKKPLPAEEHRGGDKPDWAHAKAGQELPELPGIKPPVTIIDDYAEHNAIDIDYAPEDEEQ